MLLTPLLALPNTSGCVFIMGQSLSAEILHRGVFGCHMFLSRDSISVILFTSTSCAAPLHVQCCTTHSLSSSQIYVLCRTTHLLPCSQIHVRCRTTHLLPCSQIHVPCRTTHLLPCSQIHVRCCTSHVPPSLETVQRLLLISMSKR